MAAVTIEEKNLIAAERTGSKILTASKEFKSFAVTTENTLTNFIDSITKADSFITDLPGEIKSIARIISGGARTFVSKIGNTLADALIKNIQSGLAGIATRIFSAFPKFKIALAIITRIQTALLAPVRRVARFAQGILSRLGEFLFILTAGWLTDKTLTFIRLSSEDNIDKLNEFKRKFLFDLAILGGIGVALTVGLTKLVGTVGSIAGLALKFAFSTLLVAPFKAAINFIRFNVERFGKLFFKYALQLVTKGPQKLLGGLGGLAAPALGLGGALLFNIQIKNFFKSAFGKKMTGDIVEGATKTGAKTGAKKGLKALGPLGVGLELALSPVFGFLDYRERKEDLGQTEGQAKTGATATQLGGLAGTLIGLTLLPEPLTSATGLIGLTLLSMFGGMGAGKIADTVTGANNNKNQGVQYGPPEGRADGGPVEEGKPYIVGERGQELFTPDVSGMITPINLKKESKVSDLIASFDQSAEVTVIPMSTSEKGMPSSATMTKASKTPSGSLPNIPSSDFANSFLGFSESVYNVVV